MDRWNAAGIAFSLKGLLKNWKAKLGSLVVAIIFFYYVQFTRNITRAVHIRVESPEIPQNLVLNSRVPSFVKVEFFGPRDVMDFNPSNFKVRLVNPGPVAGENRYRLELQPAPPEGIEVRLREDVSIALDRRVERVLPLVADFELTGSAGLRSGIVTINPETIRVVGPAQALSRMDRVRLTRISVVPAPGDYSSRVLVGTLPEFVSLGTDQPYEVDFRVKIIETGTGKGKEGFYERQLSVNCENAIPGLKLDESPAVNVLVRSKRPLPDGRLTAGVFCPVELDPSTRSINPSLRVTGIPVYVRDSMGQRDLEVIDITPPVVDLQFSILQMRPPTQVQKGLEEHLIR